ncbi:ArsC/Spx/MgsR family protein [Yeosuana marina]|uniref:arsenate reductase family protein n=1 Tax=Yeosuana marina TaxID=1565536 RepID=UPI0030C82953
MSILAHDKRQLTYIYSSSSHLGKQVLGYIQGIDKNIEVIDIEKEKISHSIWVEIAKELKVPFKKIFETKSISNKNEDNFTTDDWLKMIEKNPALLQKPIAINGDRIMLVSHRSEILKFFGVDSSGLEKGFNHESPAISSTTKDEGFV